MPKACNALSCSPITATPISTVTAPNVEDMGQTMAKAEEAIVALEKENFE